MPRWHLLRYVGMSCGVLGCSGVCGKVLARCFESHKHLCKPNFRTKFATSPNDLGHLHSVTSRLQHPRHLQPTEFDTSQRMLLIRTQLRAPLCEMVPCQDVFLSSTWWQLLLFGQLNIQFFCFVHPFWGLNVRRDNHKLVMCCKLVVCCINFAS